MELQQEFGETTLKSRISKFHPAVLVGVALAAILFRIHVPRFIPFLSYLEMPLLVTVYFTLMRRSQINGVITGSLIGLAQDSLSDAPLGMFGIVKTLVGFFAASLSQRFDVDNPAARGVLAFFFFAFHQFFYWVLGRALLAKSGEFDVQGTLLFGVLNGLVAVPLFSLLDKLRLKA